MKYGKKYVKNYNGNLYLQNNLKSIKKNIYIYIMSQTDILSAPILNVKKLFFCIYIFDN